MDKLNWHLAIVAVKDNIIQPQPGPIESGHYLCTCIARGNNGNIHRYLAIMHYDAEKKYWHDPDRPRVSSHNVLAWAETDICDYSDFEYVAGFPIKV